MKATAERIEKNTVLMEIEIEPEKLNISLDKAYRKLVKKANIPGFRKGKAPRTILEKFYGKKYLLEEALENLISDVYPNAVKETEIEPVDRPQVEIVQAEEGKPVILKVKVEVKPEVELGEYKGLAAERVSVEVSDADVDAELNKLQQRYAKVSNLDEGTVEQSDVAVIDFEGFLDGEPFAGGKGEEYHLEIGSGSFIPGFEEQLIGVKIGEEKDVNVSFPEEYHSTELAGKPVLFKVNIKGIRRKESLPLDDEFAKDVSEYDTLEELKNDILNRLKEAAEKKTEIAVKDQLINKAVENAKVVIPEVMINARLQVMLTDMTQRMHRQGVSFDDYLKYTGADLDSVRADLKPEAEKGLRADLVLEAIARKEDIDASDEEVTTELEKMAKQYKQDVSTIRAAMETQGSIEGLENSITFQKTIQFLVDNAKLA